MHKHSFTVDWEWIEFWPRQAYSDDANGTHKRHIVRRRCSFIGSKIPCINHHSREWERVWVCLCTVHWAARIAGAVAYGVCLLKILIYLRPWIIIISGDFFSISLAAEIYAFRKCKNAKLRLVIPHADGAVTQCDHSVSLCMRNAIHLSRLSSTGAAREHILIFCNVFIIWLWRRFLLVIRVNQPPSNINISRMAKRFQEKHARNARWIWLAAQQQ